MNTLVGILTSNYPQSPNPERNTNVIPCDEPEGFEPYNGNETWFNSLPPYTIDVSALSPCPQGIAQSVIKLQNSTIKMIKDLFTESTKYNITFTLDPALTVAGHATPNPFYYPISGQNGPLGFLDVTIKLNPDHLLNATKLSIAQTMIHEMVHAYFIAHSTVAFGDPVKEQQLAEELGFLKPYDPNAPSATYGNQHEQMANSFIQKMAAALKEYKLITDQDLTNMRQRYPNLTIDEYYEAMAWAGLNGTTNGSITKAWETFQQSNLTKAQMFNEIIQAEENANYYSASKEKCY